MGREAAGNFSTLGYFSPVYGANQPGSALRTRPEDFLEALP